MRVEFTNWGRLLFKVKIPKPELEKIKLLCQKKNELDFSEDLAGNLDHEYGIDPNKYSFIIQDYIKAFVDCYEEFYGVKPSTFKCVSAWVNYMQKGDFNPPHVHANCSYSSVLYLSVPEILREENIKYKGTVKGGGSGSISFINGEMIKDSNSIKTVFPEEGDFFMFPAGLLHFVWPFKSDCERISVAANFENHKS
jgi:uncharacterized protein (TIGR02466 family)